MPYYAVRAGHTPGVYTLWADVQRNISKYSGSDYRKFESLIEAEQYLNTKPWVEGEPNMYYAYVDGSNKGDEEYSGAVVIVKDGEIIKELSAKGADPNFRKKRNIAGELLGALLAMEWAYQNNVLTLYVCHDYVGIGKWATGDFKARDELSMAYKRSVELLEAQGMEFRFIKLKGHTGHTFNERADEVAKEALGIEK